MKRWILFCLALFALKLSFAQNMDDKTLFKKLSGNYTRSSDGISLFEDGTFLLYGYATAVFGKYRIDKEQLKFVPDKPALFEVYGTPNNTLKDSVRMNFKGFDRNRGAYMQLGNSLPTSVFNANANCFDAPFVYETKKWSGNLVLSNFLKDEFLENGGYNISWEYQLPENYNDFIFVYNAPSRYTEEFIGIVEGNVLKTSEYGSESGFTKKTVEEDGRNWTEILEWKKHYDVESAKTQDVVYANKHYRGFPEPNDNYIFDKTSQQFVLKNKQDNELYYLQNQYNDERYLRKYVKLKPVSSKDFNLSDVELAPKSIFYTVCGEGSEKSYHYNGYLPIPETAQAQQPTMLQAIPNVVIEEPKIKFYLLKHSEEADKVSSQKTVLFTQDDIIEIGLSENGATSKLSLKLNSKAIKNITNQKIQEKDEIAVMLGAKKIKASNFKVVGDTVKLLGGFTKTEIEEIYRQFEK
ncbi:MAG: hypothetical protein EOO96_03965 [Pedobacter sp.]|nr:MAG: hypothetical protein EOO96_03965 [Pedobacter sp.]